jgi:hypothetical protein
VAAFPARPEVPVKAWAVGLVGVGSALLAGLGFASGSLALGAFATALLVAWIAALWLEAPRAGALLVPGTAAVAVAAVLADVPVLPVMAGVTLAVMGWELACALESMAFHPAAEHSSPLRRHLLRLAGLGAAAFVLAVLSLEVHVHVGFRLGLALALASLVLLAVALRVGGPSAEKSEKKRAER